jgi:predicted peptidase
VSGNSRGGYGAWQYISVRPDMFAAAIPISGEGDPRFGLKIARVPVWAFHGDQDLNVPVSGSRNIINTMKFAGGKPKYTEYPNAGHDIWKSVTSTPGLLDWLFAQKRE